MINYSQQEIINEDINYVIKALKSSHLTAGPFVKKFENELCKYFGSNYATVVNNGTSALNIIAKIFNWKKNDIVVTTPITFLATANCISQTNANVAFVDICKDTYTIDPNKLESFLKKYPRRVKCVIGVDYAGHPCDWKALKYLSLKYKFLLINDACHSMGSKYYNDKKYAIKYADFVTQSYHPVKAITTGEGGSILSNRKNFDNKFKLIKNHSMIKNKKKHWEYKIFEPGNNFRITDLQCALGISQIKRLNFFIKRRREIAKIYDSCFKNDHRFHVPKVSKNIYHSYHLYPLLVNFEKLKCSKTNLIKEFLKKNIRLQVHYIPLHFQPYYKKNAIFSKKQLSISENFYKKEISLPIYPSLKKNDLNNIIKKMLSLK